MINKFLRKTPHRFLRAGGVFLCVYVTANADWFLTFLSF